MRLILIIVCTLCFALGVYDVSHFSPGSEKFNLGIFLIIINTTTITLNIIALKNGE